MNQEKGEKESFTIGQYTINDAGQIGKGSFSVVKLAFNNLDNQVYACKIVPIKMLQERKLTDRFELEVRISRSMRHAGIAAITDVSKDDVNYYLFMEYYPNGNLLDYVINRKRLSEDEAKCLMYQIFDSLQFIHKQGVTHRDLKPENIIIDQKGHLRISDFGLSRFVGENNLVKTPCGSPCYVSPECISGKEYDGLTSDIWSCGVILYAIVTGVLPWTKRKLHELFRQIRRAEFRIPSYVSEQCSSLIHMLLTVDVANRITLEEAKNHTWFNIHDSADEQKLLEYTVNLDYCNSIDKGKRNKHVHLQNNVNDENNVPYLSSKKVDDIFRPDNDDFEIGKFPNSDQNIHEIDNKVTKIKCQNSSPHMKFDDAIKLIEDDENESDENVSPLIRKRVSINPTPENEKSDNTVHIDSDSTESANLDMRTNVGLRIHSVASTGKLALLKRHDNSQSDLVRNRSHNNIQPKSLSDDENVENKNDEPQNDQQNQQNAEPAPAKKKEIRLELKPHLSAKLPSRFESNT